jgi:hypothetical protein
MKQQTWVRAAGLVLGGWVALAGAAHADDAHAPAPSTVVVQGVQVAIDPATGRLREPTAAERAALAKAFGVNASKSAQLMAQPRTAADARSTFRTVSLSNGVHAKAVKVPQELMSNVVAERQADGSLRVHHDDHTTTAPEVVK